MKRLFQTLALFSLMFHTPLALAANSNNEGWEINLTPLYLWAIDIEGDQTIGSLSGSIDVDFSDVVDNLEIAFIGRIEAMHNNTWGLAFDINYLDLENTDTIPNGVSRKFDLDLTVAELTGLRRFEFGDNALDLLLGLRYTDLSVDVDLTGVIAADGSQDWVDPIVGGRYIWSLVDRVSLIARGDIGGFGVGSDFAWHVLALIHWQPFDAVSFIAGYRALDMDYEDGSVGSPNYFNYDATVHGPVLGVNFTW